MTISLGEGESFSEKLIRDNNIGPKSNHLWIAISNVTTTLYLFRLVYKALYATEDHVSILDFSALTTVTNAGFTST